MVYSTRFSFSKRQSLTLALVISFALTGCQPNTSTVDQESANNDNDTVVTIDTTTESSTQSINHPVQIDASPSVTPSQPEHAQPEQVIEQPITILALGDSLTEGLGVAEDDTYPAQLEAALKQAGYVNATVVNSGLSGETSSGLVNRLDWVLKTKPDITILTTGANDAMRGIDVATVEDNIRTAIERLQNEGSIVVLGGMQIYDNLGNDYVQSFSSIYPKLAEEYDIAFIPFFLQGVGGVAELNQADAIHPTAEGYTYIVNNNILPVLSPVLEGIVENEADMFNEIDQ